MRRVRQVLRQLVVDAQLAGLLQLQDRRCGELFGDRTDFVVSIHGCREPALAVAQAVRLAINDTSVVDDRDDRARRAAAFEHRLHIRVDALDHRRIERRCCGDDGCERQNSG